MKITLLAEYYLPRLGGVEVMVAGLASALSARSHQVRVITTTPDDPEALGSRIPTSPLLNPPDVEVVRVPSWQLPLVGLSVSPRLPARLRDALAADPADVVHVHASIASISALAGGWGAQALGLPLVMTLHSVLGPYAWVYRLSHGLTGWGRWPQVTAGVSDHVAAELATVLERPSTVLPNGVDVAWWREGMVEPDTHDALRLIAVQRLKARKRGRALLDAMAAAQNRLGDRRRLELTLVGDGPRRPALERHAGRLGLTVHFVGTLSREELRDRFAHADVFLMASHEEAFGLAATEARAAGLPVAALNTGALPLIAPDGKAGLLTASDRSLADALVRLASDAGLLRRLGGWSRATPPPFDWSAVAQLHEDAYRSAMALAPNGSTTQGR